MIQLSAPTMDSTPPLPPWLSVAPPLVEMTEKEKQQVARDKRAILYATYDAFFERILPDIAGGAAVPALCQQDPRGISAPRFLVWVMRDPDRRRRYQEAQATAAEIVFSELIDIADAKHNPMEDVQRSALKIKTRQWYLGVIDRERFGDIKKLDVTTKNLDADKLRTVSTAELKQMILSGEYRTVPDDHDIEPSTVESDE